MLWRAMLRGTAVGLLTTAAQSVGAQVESSKDTPVPSGTMPWFIVSVDDKSQGIGGGGPGFRTQGLVTIDIRAEKPVRRVNGVDVGRKDVEAQLDTLAELVKNTLLGGQGFAVTIEVTNGSAIATPDNALLDKIYPGMLLRGPGIDAGGELVAVQTVNGDGTITLTAPYPASTGSWRFNVGAFAGGGLFEEITRIQSFPEYRGTDNKNHIAGETIEIEGHITEIYEPTITDVLNGVTIYVDSVNIFDPAGDYSGPPPLEPFATGIVPPPRTSGPDGRPESQLQIDTPS